MRGSTTLSVSSHSQSWVDTDQGVQVTTGFARLPVGTDPLVERKGGEWDLFIHRFCLCKDTLTGVTRLLVRWNLKVWRLNPKRQSSRVNTRKIYWSRLLNERRLESKRQTFYPHHYGLKGQRDPSRTCSGLHLLEHCTQSKRCQLSISLSLGPPM